MPVIDILTESGVILTTESGIDLMTEESNPPPNPPPAPPFCEPVPSPAGITVLMLYPEPGELSGS